MRTVIIILGAARSGSTLLGKAIGGHSKGFTLGEINRFNNEINNEETHCGCGEKLSECVFWIDVRNRLKEIIGSSSIKGNDSNFKVGIFNQITKSKKYKLIQTILFNKIYKNDIIDKEIDNTLLLYDTLFEKTNSKILIDSSKGLFRALVLASRANKEINFKFIQLTRDGRGVLNSSLKSSYSVLHKDGVLRKYQGEKGKKPSAVINSWLYINLRNFIILKLFYRSKTSFVRYEDFTSEPAKILDDIYTSVQLNFEEDALNLGENENHILGGNASRINAKKIKKQDDAWLKNLDKEILKKFNRKAKWFNQLIGYK
jgi:hypothetical protein